MVQNVTQGIDKILNRDDTPGEPFKTGFLLVHNSLDPTAAARLASERSIPVPAPARPATAPVGFSRHNPVIGQNGGNQGREEDSGSPRPKTS